MAVKISRRMVQIPVLLALCAAVVAAVLVTANWRMALSMERSMSANKVQQGVYELFVTTTRFLTYREEAARLQWETRYASLRSLVEAVSASGGNNEDIQGIAENTLLLEELFRQLVATLARGEEATGDEAEVLAQVTERLATQIVGRGQVMIDHAVLLTLASAAELTRDRNVAAALIVLSVSAVLLVSGLLSRLLDRAIMGDLQRLQKGAEIVGKGDLDHRIIQTRTEEIGRLATAFNTMTERLQDADRERQSVIDKLKESNRELEAFAFVASHDLQEPLRKIRAFGDLLQKKWGDRLEAGGLDYLQRMQAAAERMQALIHGLLEYSRVTTKAEPMSCVALGDVVEGVLSDLSARLAESGGVVEVSELPVVEASPVQMRQLFQNLIGNSLKFHSEKPLQIRITAKRCLDSSCASPDSQGAWAEIRVEDNGIGFDERYRDKLFQPFSRLHGRSEREGTGMGLAICSRIAQRHGGYISARGTPGNGATFIVALPMQGIQTAAPGEEGREAT